MIVIVAPRAWPDEASARLARIVTGLSDHGVARLVSVVPSPLRGGSLVGADLVVAFGHAQAKAVAGHSSLRPYTLAGCRKSDAAVLPVPDLPGTETVEQALARASLWRGMKRRGYLGRMTPADLPLQPLKQCSVSMVRGAVTLTPVCDRAATLAGWLPLSGPDLDAWQWLTFLRGAPLRREDMIAAAAWAEVDRQAAIVGKLGGVHPATVSLVDPDLWRFAKAKARALDLKIQLPPVAKEPPLSGWNLSTVEVVSESILV